jgi:acyl transferase domain-containing protein/SAM-dependent methyltransferase/NAD(P)-dependent dehydrogenase (short-subunit alcohol dehydrogenase family)/acyl carrier protein
MNDFSRRILGLSQKQLVLLATQLRSRLDDIENSAREPIAVIGIGLRFPGRANDPEFFWRLLRDRVDAVAEIPPERWDLDAWYDPDVQAPGKISTRWAGLVDGVDRFDAPFFGISPREALTMDPQQRLLLEVAWEALERAGISRERLAETRTGVFIGISGNDYSHRRLSEGVSEIDAYFASGNAHSIASGRLSYTLGLQGPSLSVDTACSSSLVAVHLAVQSLRNRECCAALAGGVNLILSPEITIALSKAGMMAPDGRCKAFDARANGFVRGEGCAVLVLKRLSDAIGEKDPILAVIRGSAVNQDGKSNGLTAPNGPSQEAVIRLAIESAGLRPEDIGYVEAHGTGTSLGDPIEASALARVFGGRNPENRLWVGSVKTNIGHLEAAGGLAGLVKIILSLGHGEIPPQLHFEAPNPLIDWENAPFRISTDPVPWVGGEKPRVAGVSAFGFSGTNVHVVLEEAPAGLAEAVPEAERPLHLLALSASDGGSLGRLAARYSEFLSAEEGPLPDICFTANAGRSHFKHRLAIVTESVEKAQSSLDAYLRGESTGAVRSGAAAGKRNSSEIAFLFTGEGSQYAGMGKELYRSHPAFRETIDRCEAILEPMIGRALGTIVFAEGHGTETGAIDRTEFAQPALFALEMALVALWRSWGFEPAWVMGHSVGEYAAACAAGLFSLEEGLKLVAERGRLMQRLSGSGGMAAFFADPLLVESAISESPGTLSIAAFNGSENTVVSGAVSDVSALQAKFENYGVRSRRLKVSQAFHSASIDPILDSFEAAFRGVSFGRLTAGFVSNVTGKPAATETVADPAYWRRHARGPVRFADAIGTLFREGCRTFLEIGPDPVLIGMGARLLPPEETLKAPSLRRGKRDWLSMLDALSELYTNGFTVDWAGFDGAWPRRKRILPTYPFERRRYWIASERKSERDRVPAWIDWLYEYGWEPKPDTGKISASAHASPAVIALDVLAEVGTLFSRHGVSIYDRFLPLLGRLCSAYIAKAFRGLGRIPPPGDRFTGPELADRFGVAPLQRPLFARMLSILAEDGIVRREEAGAYVFEAALPAYDPEELLLRLRADFPACGAELDLIGAIAGRAAEILRGACDPLTLLFPNGSLALTEKMYREAPVLRFFNGLMERLVSSAGHRSQGERRLRVLEVGAGTGGTTSCLLPVLPAERTEYLYTDVSEAFLSGAREKFADFRFLDYRRLDIDADPEGQGYAAGSFDIVVAANVLHATPDLRKSVSHIRKLLAPGGLLLLLEGTAPQRFSDLTVGFTKGWWHFADKDLRPDYPLLPRRKWERLLEENGFEKTRMLPGPFADGHPVLREQTLIVSRKPESEVRNRSWLVFADEKGGGRSLAGAVESAGVACILAFKGDGFKQHGGVSFSLDPLNPAHYRRLLEAVRSAEGRPPERIIHLWSLDETAADTPYGRDANQHRTCGSVLYLVQAISAVYREAPPQVVLITRGAQAVKPGDSVEGIDGASLWGLGRVIATEHPELKPVRIDVDGIDMAAPAAELLGGNPAETQIAWRGGERFILRLTRHAAKDRSLAALWFRADASYLVTGGLGGLGIETARRMVERGARRLCLVARKPPAPEVEKIIREMENEGAEIIVLQKDVGEPGALESILARIASGRMPLRGIIHAAGALDDGILLQQSWERFRKVMRAKVDGAWLLHTLTRNLDLDFFVLYSSGASFLGSTGQGNHAAANAFMDALAWRRRAGGLPATAINWGAWSEAGAAIGTNVVGRIGEKGMAPIGTRDGLEALEYLIASGATQVGVLPIDWKNFSREAGEGSETMIFERFAGPEGPNVEATPPERTHGLSGMLGKASPGKRYDLLLEAVRKEVVRCLRLEPGYPLDMDRPLSEMGLDSLMAVELRNALNTTLEASLPATVLFSYPSIRELVGHLSKAAFPESPDAPEIEESPTDDLDLAGATESEIERLLMEELRSI